MARNLDLRRLRYFVQVAERGSLTRAAEALHVAQPALSQHMRALEAELGVKLLRRGSRGVAVTEAGRRLLDEARRLLASLKSMAERVQGEAAEPEGDVVIGVGQTIGSLLMVPLIERARARLPKVRIQVRELMSGLLPDLVRSGAVDFAINYNALGGAGVHAVTALTEELCLVGQRRLAVRYFGRRPPGEVRFRALEGLPLYLSRRSHILRELAEAAAREKGIVLNLLAEVDSLYIMRELALGGTGFTILSLANVRGELERHDLYVARISSPVLRREICFVRRNDAELPRAARAVAGLALDVLSGLVAQNAWRGALRVHEAFPAGSPGMPDIRKAF